MNINNEDDEVWENVYFKINSKIELPVEDQLKLYVGIPLVYQIWPTLDSSLGDIVRDQVEDQVNEMSTE